MIRPLTLSLGNRFARVRETATAVWCAAGLDDIGWSQLGTGDAATLAVEADLCRRLGDAMVVRVDLADGVPAHVQAWKGLTSGYDVFYHVSRDGQVVVGDHFRNVLRLVPVDQRAPAQATLCDHFLYRTIPGEHTFSAGVKRVVRGERVSIDMTTANVRHERFDRIEQAPVPGTVEQYVDRLDAALQIVVPPLAELPDAAALFSGGVDSTLIETYLGSSVPAVCYTLPRYSDALEAGRAQDAAALLGLPLETHEAALERYLELLESAVDATAIPPPHLQLALYQPLLRLSHEQLVIGEQADALFGIDGRRTALARPFTSQWGCTALHLLERVTPGRRVGRLRQIRQTATRLGREPLSLDGYGARFGTYTDFDLLASVFGESQVRERLAARLEVEQSIVRTAAPDARFYQHIELAQMIDYFCEDNMACFRHLAHASGRTMIAPFMTRPVLDAALSIPADARYLRGRESKYIPKRLLQRRLPGYPIRQRKGYTHVPFDGHYRDGPLKAIWDKYPVPDLFQGNDRQRMVETPTPMTWNAITFAMWRQRIEHNAALCPVPETRTLTFGERVDGTPPEHA